ncbi:11483_t:CDS:2 [Rhizophagus irregularis]|nr:11483_t:CDS:2 [Rhizophagus irregularis]
MLGSADQCLLLDLQERAKIRILNELTLNNEAVLNFMEKIITQLSSAEHQTVGIGQVLVERSESKLCCTSWIPGTHIDNSSGYRYAIRKCLLQIGELIIEAIFDNIEYNESDISKSHCPEHIPKDLIDA